jgi:predicted transcriptional regulator
MTDQQKELSDGNIMISRYLYGDPTMKDQYQIGYRSMRPIYRQKDEMYSEYYENFHNNWELMMNVITKIAKHNPDEFSAKDVLIEQIKRALFQYSYDPQVVWFEVLRYIRLKLTV